MSNWERVSDPTGGTVAGLVAVTIEGTPCLFAATSVGVYRSTDGGRGWTLPGQGRIIPFAEALAAAQRTIYLCAADGLYRSSDGGETWRLALAGSRMLSVALASAAESETLVLAGTEADGILRSEDGGRSWTGANAGLLDLTALALGLSPHFEHDRVGFAGTPSGLYRSRNGAKSWRAVDLGLEEPAVQCLAVSPDFADDGLVLAGTEADGLLRSDDAGTTWQQVRGLAGQGVTAVAFSTAFPGRRVIAAATDVGVAISHDGGLSWRMSTALPGAVLSLTFMAAQGVDAEVLVAGLHRAGVARSNDDGAHWQLANAGLSASLRVGLALSPAYARDRTLYTASLQDGVSMSTDGGQTWVERNDGLADLGVMGLVVSPAYDRDRTVYAATAAGIHVSRDAGGSWELSAGSSDPARAVAATPGREGTAHLVFAAIAGGRLLGSDNAAQRWRTLDAAFDGHEATSLALSPAYARDGTLFVATSRPMPEGPAELVLWRSVDGGQHFERWLVERSDDPLVVAVPASYPVDEQLFVGLGDRVLRPMRHAREVRSRERRPVWRSTRLAERSLVVSSMATSPAYSEDRTVFVATSHGAFISRNAGDSFRPWSDDSLDPRRLVAIALSPGYPADRLVYALGLGGTIWRRED